MESLKLDRIDFEVAWWINNHRPLALKAWIEFVHKDYQRRGVVIDTAKLLGEFETIDKREQEN